MRAFRKTYFPHPGCILEGVVFTRGPNSSEPLIQVERLILKGTYVGIFTRHLASLTAEGLRIFVPAFGSAQPFHTHRSPITIGEILAKDAILEFGSRNGATEPLRFEIHSASLRDVGWKEALSYKISLHNPKPPGEITASGKFGVWDQHDPAGTRLSGDYKFERADLSIFKGIAGILSSEGKFEGTLDHIDISGTTDIPDFKVRTSSHHTRLRSEFTAYVDATHGDTYLKRVDAYFQKTHVRASGSIAHSQHGKGKTTLLNLSTSDGRIEDILDLFIQEKQSPMAGAVSLTAMVTIPPGHRPFLRKVALRGKFGIGGGEFSKPSTQQQVDKLSAGAQGEKDPTDHAVVLTDLAGQVALDAGVADFNDLSFRVPGAAARMHGTYNILSEKIDLHGQLQVDTSISNTSSGAKSFVLKILEPFLKKKNRGEILPVKISGTYQNPSFGLDLRNKRAKEVPPPLPAKSSGSSR